MKRGFARKARMLAYDSHLYSLVFLFLQGPAGSSSLETQNSNYVVVYPSYFLFNSKQ